MAGSDQIRAGASAIQRFGLGPKAGQGEAIRREARDRFLENIESGNTQQPQAPLSSANEIGLASAATRERGSIELDANAVSASATSERRQRIVAMPNAVGTNAAPDGNRPPAQQLNEPALPQKTYNAEVKARVDWALTAELGFNERIVMFWSNHFCISAGKSTYGRFIAGSYEREAIRPHVFGRFENLLLAVASHPAMLDYLDNRQSVGPNSQFGLKHGRGLNENFAREIMELHTLGVSGGYSQQDVTSLSRILTGWKMTRGDGRSGLPGSFVFRAAMHEPGTKSLLGRRYEQKGLAQGVAALTDLARHPATGQFIATKLVRHFIADDAPPKIVNLLSDVFRQSDGELASVYRALINNNEAWYAPVTKLRSPQEFLLATYRATGQPPSVHQIQAPLSVMNQRFWEPREPNGYADTNATWASPEGIKTRIDVAADWGRQAAASVADPRVLAEDLLGPLLSPETKQAVARAESKPQAIALLLMSPEFQRR